MDEKLVGIPDEIVVNKIYLIRGQKVMLDRDLAELYGVETKRLKESVRRNITRFPQDFMFEMNKEELAIWRTQFASSNNDKQGLRHMPFCFTEHGILMLSSILNSYKAIQVNIQIMRIFIHTRKMLIDNNDLRAEISFIKEELNKQDSKLSSYDKNMELVFSYLDELMEKKGEPRKLIGFKLNNEDF